MKQKEETLNQIVKQIKGNQEDSEMEDMDEESCIELAKKYIEVADQDGSGNIDLQEFLGFIMKLDKDLKSSVDGKKYEAMFNEIDTDRNGKLDEVEFGRALHQMLLES